MAKVPQHLWDDPDRFASLTQFAEELWREFDHAEVYLVGSALEDDNPEPRDWDLRLWLMDIQFWDRFGASQKWMEEGETGDWTEVRWVWSEVCTAWTKEGCDCTGLNIDFQIYPFEKWLEFLGQPQLLLASNSRKDQA